MDLAYEDDSCGEETHVVVRRDNQEDEPYPKQMMFPSQQVARFHSSQAIGTCAEIDKEMSQSSKENKFSYAKEIPEPITELETAILKAIYLRTNHPGIDPERAEEAIGRPYANAMHRIYIKKYDGK